MRWGLNLLSLIFYDEKPDETLQQTCDDLADVVDKTATSIKIAFDLAWPPLLNEKKRTQFSWRTPSAHASLVHMPNRFRKYCSIAVYNEVIFENAHILAKRVAHVAVFPGSTPEHTPEAQALRAHYAILKAKWSSERHILAAKKRHTPSEAKITAARADFAFATAKRRAMDECLKDGRALEVVDKSTVRPLADDDPDAAAKRALCAALRSAYEHGWTRSADMKVSYPATKTFVPPIFESYLKKKAVDELVEADAEQDLDDNFEANTDEDALDADTQEAAADEA